MMDNEINVDVYITRLMHKFFRTNRWPRYLRYGVQQALASARSHWLSLSGLGQVLLVLLWSGIDRQAYDAWIKQLSKATC